jgi:transcriptional regulator with XRE-family HTH domain
MDTSWTTEGLRELRLRLGWSRAEMSRRLGCSLVRWQALESGELEPLGEECDQLNQLRLHLEFYNEQIELRPLAEAELKNRGFEQIHKKDLIKSGKTE